MTIAYICIISFDQPLSIASIGRGLSRVLRVFAKSPDPSFQQKKKEKQKCLLQLGLRVLLPNLLLRRTLRKTKLGRSAHPWQEMKTLLHLPALFLPPPTILNDV
ncbi:hypothetical protein MRB53_020681 [Persea americana]|uniref:Uncharacterized protein n=1 Tax=Persea americana TaxID=3435 RepID=A0ACC2L2W0_PERAE|nr:hypothetical protein MRB53_020681 [Persea americana]